MPSTLHAMLGRLLLAAFVLLPSLGAQAQYRLGPGDLVTISIYNQPGSKKMNIPVAPDGTISYLNATKVKVAGLTVPEARMAVEGALKQINTRVVLVPVKVASKSYTILGQVPNQARVSLDRRTSLLQAIANAGGITKENATLGAINDQVDLDRSFLMRRGQRVPIDFRRLYRDGDLSQNVAIQDQDHIFIASNLAAEFYVFGFVQRQGLQRITPGLGVVGAITQQNGFAPQAWKHRVLLVRGSLTKPQPVTVNLSEILRGKQPDVAIQPGDILYVHKRPWYYPETILDSAFTAFTQAVATTYVDKETGARTNNTIR